MQRIPPLRGDTGATGMGAPRGMAVAAWDGGGSTVDWDSWTAVQRREATTDECRVGETSFREEI